MVAIAPGKGVINANVLNWDKCVRILDNRENATLSMGTGLARWGSTVAGACTEYRVYHHKHLILSINPRNEFQLYSGRFPYKPTLDRLNEYSPVGIGAHKGLWFVHRRRGPNWNTWEPVGLFQEGMITNIDGIVTVPEGGLPNHRTAISVNRRLRAIRRQYLDNIPLTLPKKVRWVVEDGVSPVKPHTFETECLVKQEYVPHIIAGVVTAYLGDQAAPDTLVKSTVYDELDTLGVRALNEAIDWYCRKHWMEWIGYIVQNEVQLPRREVNANLRRLVLDTSNIFEDVLI